MTSETNSVRCVLSLTEKDEFGNVIGINKVTCCDGAQLSGTGHFIFYIYIFYVSVFLPPPFFVNIRWNIFFYISNRFIFANHMSFFPIVTCFVY